MFIEELHDDQWLVWVRCGDIVTCNWIKGEELEYVTVFDSTYMVQTVGLEDYD